MTRIDLTTREWHELIKPVIPHASTDAEVPEINVIRLEGHDGIVYAVATDRYTLAAERHRLAAWAEDFVICVDRADAAALLKLFIYGKDDDPQLRITIDTVPVPMRSGPDLRTLGLTIESEAGTRLVLHDRPGALSGWRKTLAAVIYRAPLPAAPRLLLTPSQLARWGAASRKGERLAMFAGPEPGDPLLFLVEDHFAGCWKPAGHLDEGSDDVLYDSPWRGELREYEPAEDDGDE